MKANPQGHEEFHTVRRRGKPWFQSPEIKTSMRVDNRYGILTELEDDQTEVQEVDDQKWEIRAKKTNPPTAQGKGPQKYGSSSSSSKRQGVKDGSSSGDDSVILREEDREKHLYSAGAVTPQDISGRKKLRNVSGNDPQSSGGSGNVDHGRDPWEGLSQRQSPAS
ncbi:hypothetical protein R1sor_027403 [Riccia sorocarpa]|uniref:Uncharacterized protein n=1 Tax=Riccia sorocarpa TaxID=122646 RepID=A0ABD3GHE1_9MARC